MEYLAIADRHSGMLSVHATVHRGAKELLKILRLHCQRSGIPRCVYTDGSSIFCTQEVKDFFKRYDIEHFVSSVGHPHANLRSEVFVKILKRILRDVVSESGNLDSDAVTEALLCYAYTKCRVLKKYPAEIALGRCLKDFYPRQVSSLLPSPETLLSGPVKDKLQETTREVAGLRWSEHSKVLQPLQLGDWVQLQNLKGSHPLKSDYSGEIVGTHNVNSYAVKINGTNQVMVRNGASLRKIPPPVSIHIPVIGSDLSRPAREPRPGLAAPPAPSRVTRSRGQGDMVSRQSTMNTMVPPALSRVTRPEVQGGTVPRRSIMNKGPNEGSRHGGNVPSQTGLRSNEGPSQAFYEDVCDNMMKQVADWDYPGNVVRQAFHKPPAPALVPHVADSGQSCGQAGAVQPVQSASPRVQPAGAGAVLEVQDRLASRGVSQGNNLVVQDSVGGQLVKLPPNLLGPSPSAIVEVGPVEIRRSGRQRSQMYPYQAGAGGMEKSDNRV